MRSMMYCLLVALLVSALTNTSVAAAAEETIVEEQQQHELLFQTGTAHSSVVVLSQSTLVPALEDPANAVWLLKFYAPWCGHCKQLAPVLDKVAKHTIGKMAIGKIDCTQERNLCEQHNIRSFPTLKFSVDGTIVDYPGGRKTDDFLDFADKMSSPAVKSVSSIEQAVADIGTSENGVAFVAYHAKATGDTMDEKLQSTLLTQVLAQVARKQQAYADFMLLEVDNDGTLQDPFFCRMEQHVEPRCIKDLSAINTMDMLDFVKAHNAPTVSKLGPNNFYKIGRMGGSLVVGVVDGQDAAQVANVKQILTDYATSGAENIRDKYYYGYFDGNVWKKFLAQFDIDLADSPQIFMLDVPTKSYWANTTYGLNVGDFLAAIEDGTVKKIKASEKGGLRFMQLLKEYQPWSIIVMFLLGAVFAVGVFKFAAFDEEEADEDGDDDDQSEAEEKVTKEAKKTK